MPAPRASGWVGAARVRGRVVRVGRDSDQLSAQRRATGAGVAVTGEGAGGAEKVVRDWSVPDFIDTGSGCQVG